MNSWDCPKRRGSRSGVPTHRGLNDKGVPGKVVAQLMGHSNVDTTLNVYTQVLDGSVRDAVEKIGSELITIVHFSETADPLSH